MTATETMVKMILDRWDTSLNNFDHLLNSISDEQLQKEIAPKRNRGVYLLGHLIAVHDLMIPLLDMGEKLYPDLQRPFFELPDKAVTEIPSATELREYWIKHREWLKQKFKHLQPDDWFEKHTAVSDEDFVKEPHRNKLNIILTRTTHLQYHIGQFLLLKEQKIKMESTDFTLTILVNQSPAEVFKTLLDVRGWWSGLYEESFEGHSKKTGDEFTFLAGGGAHYTKQKLEELVPDKKLVWLVTESNLSFVEKTNEWTGTKICFEISKEQDKTKVVFTHIGLVPEFECYNSCAPAWTQYLQTKLLPLIKSR